MSKIQLYQGDCLKLMKQIPDKSIDMVLCDLPYGITQCEWDKKIPLDLLWEQYNRISKLNAAIVLFSMMPFTSELIQSNLKCFKYVWIWHKHYTRGFLNARKQPLRTTEQIAVFYKKQCTYNPQMRKGELRQKRNGSRQNGCYGKYKSVDNLSDSYYPTDILNFVGVSNLKTQHPTQKPVSLLEYLIKTYANEGETVLDNCMGSGSTGVACINTNRNFIGIELDQHYFQIAKERIEKAGVENA